MSGSENESNDGDEAFAAAVAHSVSDVIVMVSVDGIIQVWNPAAEGLLGYGAEELAGLSVADLMADGAKDVYRRAVHSLSEAASATVQAQWRRRDGSPIEIAATLLALRNDSGRLTGAVLMGHPVEDDGVAARLREADRRFKRAFAAASTGMALLDADGVLLDANASLCRMLQRDRADVVGRSNAELTHPEDRADGFEQVHQTLAAGVDQHRHTPRYLLPDGGIVWASVTYTVARSPDGRPESFIAQIEDVSSQKAAEFELRRYSDAIRAHAERDPLTGLINQPAFVSLLANELKALSAAGEQFTILLAEMQSGLDVLAAATALKRMSRESDVVARIGDRELVVLLRGLREDAAQMLAGRLQERLPASRSARSSVVTVRPGDRVDDLLATLRERLDVAAQDTTPAATIQRLLELTRAQLGMSVAFLSRIEGDEYLHESVAGAEPGLGVRQGDVLSLHDTVCARMLDGRVAPVLPDIDDDPEAREVVMKRGTSARAYAGIPIHLRSGELYGTLCALDVEPHPELAQTHVQVLRFLAEVTADLLDQQSEDAKTIRAEASVATVHALLVALEARDFYTGDHSRHVVELAVAVSEHLGLQESTIQDIEQVALLHDLGKVGIPDSVLRKHGPLDEHEWTLMRHHPVIGERIVAATAGLTHLAPAVRAEHERWDGGGYPDGLEGEQIPIASRISLACDAVHAMTSDRPYRPAMTQEHAQAELRSCAGTQFDPQVAEALLEILAAASRDG